MHDGERSADARQDRFRATDQHRAVFTNSDCDKAVRNCKQSALTTVEEIPDDPVRGVAPPALCLDHVWIVFDYEGQMRMQRGMVLAGKPSEGRELLKAFDPNGSFEDVGSIA